MGFTLIEVLAALAIIVVLTLALIVTVKGQVEQAQKKDTELMISTVNSQIEVQAADADQTELAGLHSIKGLYSAGYISNQQMTDLNKAHVKIGTQDGLPHLSANSK